MLLIDLVIIFINDFINISMSSWEIPYTFNWYKKILWQNKKKSNYNILINEKN